MKVHLRIFGDIWKFSSEIIFKKFKDDDLKPITAASLRINLLKYFFKLQLDNYLRIIKKILQESRSKNILHK